MKTNRLFSTALRAVLLILTAVLCLCISAAAAQTKTVWVGGSGASDTNSGANVSNAVATTEKALEILKTYYADKTDTAANPCEATIEIAGDCTAAGEAVSKDLFANTGTLVTDKDGKLISRITVNGNGHTLDTHLATDSEVAVYLYNNYTVNDLKFKTAGTVVKSNATIILGKPYADADTMEMLPTSLTFGDGVKFLASDGTTEIQILTVYLLRTDDAANGKSARTVTATFLSGKYRQIVWGGSAAKRGTLGVAGGTPGIYNLNIGGCAEVIGSSSGFGVWGFPGLVTCANAQFHYKIFGNAKVKYFHGMASRSGSGGETKDFVDNVDITLEILENAAVTGNLRLFSRVNGASETINGNAKIILDNTADISGVTDGKCYLGYFGTEDPATFVINGNVETVIHGADDAETGTNLAERVRAASNLKGVTLNGAHIVTIESGKYAADGLRTAKSTAPLYYFTSGTTGCCYVAPVAFGSNYKVVTNVCGGVFEAEKGVYFGFADATVLENNFYGGAFAESAYGMPAAAPSAVSLTNNFYGGTFAGRFAATSGSGVFAGTIVNNFERDATFSTNMYAAGTGALQCAGVTNNFRGCTFNKIIGGGASSSSAQIDLLTNNVTGGTFNSVFAGSTYSFGSTGDIVNNITGDGMRFNGTFVGGNYKSSTASGQDYIIPETVNGSVTNNIYADPTDSSKVPVFNGNYYGLGCCTPCTGTVTNNIEVGVFSGKFYGAIKISTPICPDNHADFRIGSVVNRIGVDTNGDGKCGRVTFEDLVQLYGDDASKVLQLTGTASTAFNAAMNVPSQVYCAGTMDLYSGSFAGFEKDPAYAGKVTLNLHLDNDILIGSGSDANLNMQSADFEKHIYLGNGTLRLSQPGFYADSVSGSGLFHIATGAAAQENEVYLISGTPLDAVTAFDHSTADTPYTLYTDADADVIKATGDRGSAAVTLGSSFCFRNYYSTRMASGLDYNYQITVADTEGKTYHLTCENGAVTEDASNTLRGSCTLDPMFGYAICVDVVVPAREYDQNYTVTVSKLDGTVLSTVTESALDALARYKTQFAQGSADYAAVDDAANQTLRYAQIGKDYFAGVSSQNMPEPVFDTAKDVYTGYASRADRVSDVYVGSEHFLASENGQSFDYVIRGTSVKLGDSISIKFWAEPQGSAPLSADGLVAHVKVGGEDTTPDVIYAVNDGSVTAEYVIGQNDIAKDFEVYFTKGDATVSNTYRDNLISYCVSVETEFPENPELLRMAKALLNYVHYTEKMIALLGSQSVEIPEGLAVTDAHTQVYGADFSALESIYAGLQSTYAGLHEHSDSGKVSRDGKLIGSDGKFTLKQWKEELMPELGYDVTAIVDHRQVQHMYSEDWDSDLFICGSEPSTHITDLSSASNGKAFHYAMLFDDKEDLGNVVSHFTEFGFRGDDPNPIYHGFGYPDFTKARFQELVDYVRSVGGIISYSHPVGSADDSTTYMTSTDIEDYFRGEFTYFDTFVSTGPYTVASQKAYGLWEQLLQAGHHIYATAIGDTHSKKTCDPCAFYTADKKAAQVFQLVKDGNFAAGFMGIKMNIGDKPMGSVAGYQPGEVLTIEAADLFQKHSAVTPDSRFYLRVFTENGLCAYKKINSTGVTRLAITVQDRAYYHADIYNADNGCAIAIGNPIWKS